MVDAGPETGTTQLLTTRRTRTLQPMPKGHRAASTTLVRTHSRSSSSSKLGATLQFTQKDPVVDKSKKGHEVSDISTAVTDNSFLLQS